MSLNDHTAAEVFDAGLLIGAGSVAFSAALVYLLTPVFGLPFVLTPTAAWVVCIVLFVWGEYMKYKV